MNKLTKLDHTSYGLLIALLVLAAILGIVGVKNEIGGPAAVRSALACVSSVKIEESTQRVNKLTTAVKENEARLAKAREALSSAQASGTKSRLGILKGELARANAALTAARASLKAAQAAHTRLVARQCTGSDSGSATTTPPVLVEYVNAGITRMNGAVDGDADTAEFKINFKVTAVGDDVYLDGDTVALGNPTTTTDGLAWSTTTDSTTGTSTYTAIVTAMDGYKSSDVNSSGDKRFKIPAGSSRTFTFTTSISAGTDNSVVGIQLNGFKWGTESADVMGNLYTVGIENFRSDVMTGMYIR